MADAPPSPTPPAPDPMLDELRAIKTSISERFGNDPRRLAESLRELEARHADRVVRPVVPAPRHAAG